MIVLLSTLFLTFGTSEAAASQAQYSPDVPCSPSSEYVDLLEGGLSPAFCSEWNPDFVAAGHRCCSKPPVRSRRRRAPRCAPERTKISYCDEMTADQLRYTELVKSGKVDVLDLIQRDMGRRSPQSFCNVNNGFLAYGRRLIPTPENRIKLRYPERCTEFGTDGLVGMLEWTGRELKNRYSVLGRGNVHLIVGNLSAPRGGCLSGFSGRRGHASHTSGLDVDIAFLDEKTTLTEKIFFTHQFNTEANWWLIKKIFNNPYACVKAVFLDKRLIRKLARTVADEDPDWERYRPYIRHVRGHRNHFHIRVGTRPGQPGCSEDPEQELEEEEGLSEELEVLLRTAPSERGRQAASEARSR